MTDDRRESAVRRRGRARGDAGRGRDDGKGGARARLRAIDEDMARALEADDERARSASGREGEGATRAGYRDSRRHTLQRHRDVLQEYADELRRLRRDAEDAAERESLLGGRAGSSASGGPDESAEARLIRERARIAGSASAMDDIISVAQNTARELFAQRGILQNAGAKILTMTSKFPVLNNLVLAIKRKKNKDAMILAAVVAACTTFVLLYYLSK